MSEVENKYALVVGNESASMEQFMGLELPGLIYDPTKPCMKQIKDWVARQPGNEGLKPGQVKTIAEDILHNKLRPYKAAVIDHINREYNFDLPRYSKKVNPITGQPKSGSLRFTEKPVRPMTEKQVLGLYQAAKSGDVAAQKRLKAAGIIAAEEKPAIREAEVTV
jgi:hypothetical protein